MFHLVAEVFPVYTGINRVTKVSLPNTQGVPCIHRDKPGIGNHSDKIGGVFPVYTGINRLRGSD